MSHLLSDITHSNCYVIFNYPEIHLNIPELTKSADLNMFRILLEDPNMTKNLLRKIGETVKEPFLVTYERTIY